MSTTQHISFAQFAEDFAKILDTVREQQASIVVEYASGEKLLIRPFSPSDTEQAPRAGAAPADDAGTPQPPRANQELDTDNPSSVGAMYDIDPNSVTPG